MLKKRNRILSLLLAILLALSASMTAFASSPDELRYNNTVMTTTDAYITGSGQLKVLTHFQGIKGQTTKGEITTYVEKKILGLFWQRVDIGQPNNQWYDVIYNYSYSGTHTFQLNAHGTYRITVIYVISGSEGSADTITERITKTY